MNLRDILIEAGARRRWERAQKSSFDKQSWEDTTWVQRLEYRRLASEDLDADLDVLSEHADEWKKQARRVTPSYRIPGDVESMLAVLREDAS